MQPNRASIINLFSSVDPRFSTKEPPYREPWNRGSKVPPVDAWALHSIGADALHRGIFEIDLGFGFRSIQPHVLCWTLHVHNANATVSGHKIY